MYTPAAFRVEDRDAIHAVMQQNSFATLVTNRDGVPFATHLPFILHPGRSEMGTLQAHLARPNPQWENWSENGSHDPKEEVLVLFQGPHAYISPSWYTQHPSVPTWNYVAVHAYGKPRLLTETELHQLLVDLTNVYERDRPEPWTMESLPEGYTDKMMRGIVGVEIVLTQLEGKCKMSQNRSNADRVGVIAGLTDENDAQALATARLMASLDLP